MLTRSISLILLLVVAFSKCQARNLAGKHVFSRTTNVLPTHYDSLWLEPSLSSVTFLVPSTRKSLFCRGGGEESPVKSTNTETAVTTTTTEKKKKRVSLSSRFNRFKDIFFPIEAVIAVALSISTLITKPTLLVNMVAWTCMFLGPAAALLQRKLSLLENLREITNELRQNVNRAQASNAALKKQNERLESNSKKLQKSQDALEAMSSAQGMTVDTLVEQVDRYKKIQAEIKTDLKYKIQQTLISVLLKSDSDEDFVIDPEEVNSLVLRLKNIPNVEFDEAKFRKVLKNEGGDMMNFIDRNLSGNADPNKEGVFKF